MTEQPEPQIKGLSLIAEPFKTDVDVTSDTPITDIPGSYYANGKTRLLAQQAFLDSVAKGMADLSVDSKVEDFILNEIHLSVSSLDDPVIKTVFHAAVSAFASPLNIALKAESGSGKSYSTLETVKFLPSENVMSIGSDSPKVISHLNGVRKTVKNGVEVIFDEIPEPVKPDKTDFDLESAYSVACQRFREDLKEYQKLKDNSFYEVDLRNKIIVYLESINPETFKMLKATMSHDGPYIDHRFVDDKGKVHVTRLIGAPVLIFNSLDNYFMAEFATRTLTISPVTTKEKIDSAMRISNRKSCYPWLFDAERLNKTVIQEYLRKVRDTLKAGNIKTINVFDGVTEEFSKNQVRDMRDFNKFLELLPSYAIVKLYQRPIVTIKNQRYLVPAIKDFLDAKAVFDSVAETTKTGTEQRIISFYWDCVADKVNGSTLDVLTDQYNESKKKPVSSRRIRGWLDRLVEIEFVDPRAGEQVTAKGNVDLQKITFHPLKLKGNNAILPIAIDLVAKLESAFDLWFKTCAEEVASHPIIILNIDGTANQISLEELCEIVKGGEPTFTAQVFKPEATTEQQTEPKNIAKYETATFSKPIEDKDGNVIYEQKNIELKFKLSKNGQPCEQCKNLASEYELIDSQEPSVKIYVCGSCLKTNVIPAYKAQNAKITPTEETS